ncbi:hypothetical protein SD81_030060 [Tolypothrix campylonemoides VB511288]|nr:hypothetical protein SD81_030060 [Tolypothrix campylonemoides VB511288]
MRKRDIQGKFALKNDDYRQVRSLRFSRPKSFAIVLGSRLKLIFLYNELYFKIQLSTFFLRFFLEIKIINKLQKQCETRAKMCCSRASMNFTKIHTCKKDTFKARGVLSWLVQQIPQF